MHLVGFIVGIKQALYARFSFFCKSVGFVDN